jgi:hypothetical protein
MHSYSESVRISLRSSERDLPRDVPSAKGEGSLWSDDEQNADCDEQPAERRHGKIDGCSRVQVKRPIAPVEMIPFLDPR